MRRITLIVIHCDGIMPHQHNTIAKINAYHIFLGWKGVGYHYFVDRQGQVATGRPLEEVGAHVRYHNKYSIGVCYEGGLDASGRPADTRTPEQRVALRALVEKLHRMFPKAVIVGHHDLDPTKACPCFDAAKEYRDLQP